MATNVLKLCLYHVYVMYKLWEPDEEDNLSIPDGLHIPFGKDIDILKFSTVLKFQVLKVAYIRKVGTKYEAITDTLYII